ncbi:NAD(P)H-quinone oxidoreductase [Mesorhizobium sp. A556]
MNKLPDTMQAIMVEVPGGADVLRLKTVPIPTPQHQKVLIKVDFAGVCRPDLMQREGKFPAPPGDSPILGLEVSGEVIEVGAEADASLIGQKVAALLPGGGYAEYAVADGRLCLPVPASLSMQEAGGLPESLFTVWHNLYELADLRPGETVLIHGGASGVGTIAIQLARATGARVLATVGSQDKAEAIRSIGCDRPIVYKREDFVAVAQEETGGRGIDVVLDIVGGPYLARNLSALGTNGRHVSISFMQGSVVPIDLAIIMAKGLRLTASSLRPKTNDEKARIARAIEKHAWPLIGRGVVRPMIHKVLPLAEAAAAHLMLEASSHIGKVLLKMPP